MKRAVSTLEETPDRQRNVKQRLKEKNKYAMMLFSEYFVPNLVAERDLSVKLVEGKKEDSACIQFEGISNNPDI